MQTPGDLTGVWLQSSPIVVLLFSPRFDSTCRSSPNVHHQTLSKVIEGREKLHLKPQEQFKPSSWWTIHLISPSKLVTTHIIFLPQHHTGCVSVHFSHANPSLDFIYVSNNISASQSKCFEKKGRSWFHCPSGKILPATIKNHSCWIHMGRLGTLGHLAAQRQAGPRTDRAGATGLQIACHSITISCLVSHRKSEVRAFFFSLNKW